MADLLNGKLPNIQKTINLLINKFDDWAGLMGMAQVLSNPFKNPIVVANLSLSEDAIKKIDAKLKDIENWSGKNEKKTDEETQAKKVELATTRQNLEAAKVMLRKAIDLDKELYNLSKALEKLEQNQNDLQKAENLLPSNTELNPELQTISLKKAEKELSKTVENLKIWLQANKNCKFETEADKQKFVSTIQTMNSQIGNCIAISVNSEFDAATQQKAIDNQVILEKAQQEIAQLCANKINIAFETKNNLVKTGGYCDFTIGTNGEPTILIVSKDNSPSTIAHELCHAAQFKRGEVAYILSNGQFSAWTCYDLYDEVEAHRVSQAMNLNQTNAEYLATTKEITPEWVQNAGKPTNKYQTLKRQNLTLNSTTKELAIVQVFALLRKINQDVTLVTEKTDAGNVNKAYYKGIEIFTPSIHDTWTTHQYLSSTINGIKIIDVVSPILKVNL